MNAEVAQWLGQFEASPVETLHALVLGRTAVPAWSRTNLREVFLEIRHTHSEKLDDAVAAWLAPRIFQPPPERTPEEVWASHLQDIFRAVAGIPMPKVERLLRDRLRDFRSWLRPFRYAESCDPEAAFLVALTWATTNHGLEGMWQSLALRKDREPPYCTDIGLLGLCKARDAAGELPPKATFLLRATLLDLADSGMPYDDWELTTRALLASYPVSAATWVREFEPVLAARPDSQNGPRWLRRILPLPVDQPATEHQASRPLPPAHSLSEKNAMIAEIERDGPISVGTRLTTFLDKERNYANLTRDSYFLVRTFNRLAEAARYHDPDWAITRVEEALAWDAENARNWTVLARCLWARGRQAQRSCDRDSAKANCGEAIDVLWKARFRFPYNHYVRNELAKMLRASGDLETAEVIYREGKAEFPRNPWFLTGLADLLLQRNANAANRAARDEARDLFQHAAALGNNYAMLRLNDLDRPPEQAVEGVDLPTQEMAEMRPAQRLGRGLLCKWQAIHANDPAAREQFFAESESLLALPDASAGDCRMAFVEARGFLLLARAHAAEAKAYFEQQLNKCVARRPLGLRLGLAEARSRLGEPLSDLEAAELESFGPQGSILPLILKVLRLLEVEDSDAAMRASLLQLYPTVRTLLGMPASELGEEEEPPEPQEPRTTAPQQSADTMLASLVAENIFKPVGITSSVTLQSDESLNQVRTALRNSRQVFSSATEKLALVA